MGLKKDAQLAGEIGISLIVGELNLAAAGTTRLEAVSKIESNAFLNVATALTVLTLIRLGGVIDSRSNFHRPISKDPYQLSPGFKPDWRTEKDHAHDRRRSRNKILQDQQQCERTRKQGYQNFSRELPPEYWERPKIQLGKKADPARRLILSPV